MRYRHAAFVPPGYCSFLHAGTWDRAVPEGAVDSLEDYRAYLLVAHDVDPRERVAGAPTRVTVISRRPYSGGVDRAYLPRRFGTKTTLLPP